MSLTCSDLTISHVGVGSKHFTGGRATDMLCVSGTAEARFGWAQPSLTFCRKCATYRHSDGTVAADGLIPVFTACQLARQAAHRHIRLMIHRGLAAAA